MFKSDRAPHLLGIAALRKRIASRLWSSLSQLFDIVDPSASDALAEERSIQLLKEKLLPLQREQFEKLGYFEVVGSKTATRYRIRHGRQLNIEQLDAEGKRVRLLCFKPAGCVTVGDILLGQKRSLELFEEDAIRASHRFLAEPPRSHYIDGTTLERAYRDLARQRFAGNDGPLQHRRPARRNRTPVH